MSVTTVKDLERQLSIMADDLAALDSRLKLLETGKSAKVRPATDEQLDSTYGNPRVFSDPKQWEGESQKNKYYSDCPPEFLEKLAAFLVWQAEKNEEQANNPTEAAQWGGSEKMKKSASFKRLDAARALGWARRLRAGYKPATTPALSDDSDIPF